MDEQISQNLMELSAEIAVSYLSANRLPIEQLPDLLTAIYQGVNRAASNLTDQPAAKQEPAVPIKKSVTQDYIVCLEDGRKYKSIKRHIMETYGLTPADYRAKWGLPSDYPMVAPGYSAMRSALAKELGLGFDRPAQAKRAVGRRAKRPSSSSR
jgi:predicted transcriptional regulator